MIEITVDASDLMKWSANFSNIPKQTKPALARALNRVGEQTARGAAQFIANQADLDANAVYEKIAITQATPDSLEWSMDSSAISPPSLDWSRPWGERDTDSFDQDTMVKVVTMGDGDVCELCIQAADDSPYTLAEAYQLRHGSGGDGCLIHQNCILPGAVIEGKVEVASKAFYAGEAIEIVTASKNYRLSLTVNHPVLTRHGWIAAGKLEKGMQLLTYNGDIGLSHSEAKHNNFPARIEDIFITLALKGFCSRSASNPDFHSDARSIKGNIDVVIADSGLLANVMSEYTQTIENVGFKRANAYPKFFSSGFSSFNTFSERSFSTTNGIMSSGDLLISKLISHTAPLDSLRFGLVANIDVIVDKHAPNDATIHSKFISELFFRSSSLVEFDEISELRRFKYVGHVYDLQTTTGWMIANHIGIVNCRCGLAPWSSSRKLPVVFNKPGEDMPSGMFTPAQLGEAVVDELKVSLFVTGR